MWTLRAAVLLIALVTLSSAQDCRFTSTKVYDYSDVLKCRDSLAFSSALRVATMSNVRKTMQLYAFRDIVKNSPQSPLTHITVDLDAEFARIDAANYQTDYDFQTDLGSVFLRLKDAHTLYILPSCYNFFALQPFALRSRMNANNQQEIFVSDVYAYAQAGWPEVDFSELMNSTILSIDGQDAFKTLWTWAQENEFESKDTGSSFNRVLDYHYQQRSASIFPLPDNTDQEFVLQLPSGDTKTISFPWKAKFRAAVQFDSSCTATQAAAAPEPHIALSKKEQRLPGHYDAVPTMRSFKKHEKLQERVLFQDGGSIQIFNLTSQIIVARIVDFEPQSDDEFLDALEDSIEYADKNNVPYLILDLRSNGGGSICLGYQVLNRLMHERHPEGDYDIIKSPLMNLMFTLGYQAGGAADTEIFDPGFFSGTNGQVYNDLAFFDPGVKYSRGGSVSNYSLPVHHACDYNDTADPTFLFKKIILLTDGLCGSTCAVFTTHLADVDHVDTMVIGGMAGAPQQYFSFPGGQVMSYGNLLYFLSRLGLQSSQLSPTKFPNGAQISYTFLEIYPWKLPDQVDNSFAHEFAAKFQTDPRYAAPLEFVWHPSDQHLPIWNFADDDDVELWEAVAPYFTKSK